MTPASGSRGAAHWPVKRARAAVVEAAAPLAITRLLETRPLTAAAIDAFLAQHAVPIVEGTHCTFLYRGEADSVSLRHFIYGLPATQPFRRARGADLWYLTLEVPERSRVEYKLEVTLGGLGRWIEDPLNPHKAHDPFGANSVCYGEGYEVPDWTLPDPEARLGTLEEMTVPSRALEDEFRISLYLPARFRRTRRYPLLVVHDGGDYLNYSGMQTVLDNLIHRLEVSEMVVAFLHPHQRLVEYGANAEHARFLTEELVPLLEERYPLEGVAAGRCLMGASFGAVASFNTAWRYPHFYGRLLLQSGSFAFTDIGPQQRGPAFEPVVELINTFRNAPRPLAERVFVSCGTYESVIYENRSLVPVLEKTGMDVRYVEARDGHNWENWRDRLREGLSWLYPGPLWMVYE